MCNSDATERLVRFINLMREHHEIEKFLCYEIDYIDKEDFVDLANLMMENGFYEMVYMMLVRFEGEPLVYEVKKDIFAENLIESIYDTGANGFCEKVVTKMEQFD